MNGKKFFPVVLTILFLMESLICRTDSVQAEGTKTLRENELYAKSAVLMDADSGRILYGKNPNTPLANASTTKILTCILTLENCDLNSEVTVSSHAASQPKVRLGMKEGQVFLLEDLLYALMLESYNDCAVAIAEFIAGTTEDFAKLMNDKAGKIGCENTYFITPNGLDAMDENGFHHTTASDLALIMRYCISLSPKAEEFLTITRAADRIFSEAGGTKTYHCYNHNAFLHMMEGVLSGKTGFTGNAGYCYVGSLRRDERTYIVALLACGWPNNKTWKWADTKKLMNYGLDNFVKIKLADFEPETSTLRPIYVENAGGDVIGEDVFVTPVIGETEGKEEVLARPEEEVTLRYEYERQLSAPIDAGTTIGTLTYLLGDEVLKVSPITVEETVSVRDFLWCMGRVFELFEMQK